SAYEVYRDVTAYGAKGDGVTDDTSAIIEALTKDRSATPGAVYPSATYAETTQRAAYVYFPPGEYKITKTLPLPFYTQMVGDVENLPVIKFVDDSGTDQRVLDAFGQWFNGVNQNNFYRGVTNFIVDMTSCSRCTGVHWQVAQATSITNVLFKMTRGSESQGMFMENGSGGFFSDLVFEGGKYGIWIGSQQFTSRNITIRDTTHAGIFLQWDWVWSFKGLDVSNTPVAIDVAKDTGTVLIIDSTFSNCSLAAIRTTFDASVSGKGSLVLDNVEYHAATGASTVLLNGNNHELRVAAGATSLKVESYVQGHVWDVDGITKLETYPQLNSFKPSRSAALVDSTGQFFGMAPPQLPRTSTVDVTTLGILGDGATDVTSKLQTALRDHAGRVALFFPFGRYLITDTVYVPPGSRLVGECWSVLMASGDGFSNASAPKPMLKVGMEGEEGVAQMMNLLLSAHGPQPGAKLLEWNMRAPAGSPGACGMWDVHFRIGGAVGTKVRKENCPRGDGTSAPEQECNGVWGLMHITHGGNCYMENGEAPVPFAPACMQGLRRARRKV
ncbi:hypothetical protein CYMTET_33636, partial [Cymbomonas tetramitiformis]